MSRDSQSPADLQALNEETPSLDDPVAVGWWFNFNEDDTPELDTPHGFHDATQFATSEPPNVETGELVAETGERVDAESRSAGATESRYLYMTHEEALSRDISPCPQCFPAYATEARLATEREEGGLLGESGVEGAVFVVQTRRTLSSSWEIDSVHETYTSMLYRMRAIRHQIGSAAERLRFSYMPIRRCDYASFEEAIGFEPAMEHVSDLRVIQPEELEAVRESVSAGVLATPVEIDHRSMGTPQSAPSVVHQADNPPCGFEREWATDVPSDEQEELGEQLNIEVQTLEDVIEQGNVVEYCAECFPGLVGWGS